MLILTDISKITYFSRFLDDKLISYYKGYKVNKTIS